MNKDKLLTLVLWVVIIISSVLAVLYLIWASVYRVETKKMAILNYYNFPVSVSFLSKQENFEPFEVRTFDINTKEAFNIVTKKQDSTELSNIQISGLKLPTQLIQVVLSETKDYCFFNANVTSIYTNQDDLIEQVNVLSKNPLDYFIFGINQNNINVFPGSSSLNEQDIKFKEVKGFYPIRCGLIQNPQEIEKVVKTFVSYDFKKQLEFFNQQKDKIQNTLNLEELNNI